MSTFSLEDFDKHIANLRSQLTFLNSALDATDHNAPDWLASDLLALRNKSGRLQDDMQRFRDQIESEGLGARKTNKRLSLEGLKSQSINLSSMQAPNSSTPRETPTPSSPAQPPTPTPKRTRLESDYVVQHIDVTEEVNRRLQESRLRRLMDTPSTSQKRKYHVFEPPRADNGMGDRYAQTEGETLLDRERSPKKLRASAGFEGFEDRLKRKDGAGEEKVEEQQNGHKRRRL